MTLAGLHVHIGSQLLDLHPLEDALAEALQILDAGRAAGAPLSTLDLGGGFGIDYAGDGATFPLEAWGRTLCAAGAARAGSKSSSSRALRRRRRGRAGRPRARRQARRRRGPSSCSTWR